MRLFIAMTFKKLFLALGLVVSVFALCLSALGLIYAYFTVKQAMLGPLAKDTARLVDAFSAELYGKQAQESGQTYLGGQASIAKQANVFASSKDALDSLRSLSSLAEFKMQFKKFKLQHPHTLAWLKLDHSHINYPLLKTDNNHWYLHHDYRDQPSPAGSIFLDYRHKLTDTSLALVYGHRMFSGQMFSDLGKIRTFADFQKLSRGLLVSDTQLEALQAVLIARVPTASSWLYDATASSAELFAKLKSYAFLTAPQPELLSTKPWLILSTCDGKDHRLVFLLARLKAQ